MLSLFTAPFSARKSNNTNSKTSSTQHFAQKPERAGLLVTKELDDAIERCKNKVERIVRECRQQNRRFRDVEFDIEEDKTRCLHDLTGSSELNPDDVLRVTQIFEQPQFFIDGASSADIRQGQLGDCWFLSAIATVSTVPGLIEKICVARDEKVGVYGFIFYRDAGWVEVIIDDLLYVSLPKFENLDWTVQKMYQMDRDMYNSTGRKGRKALYFASSETENETWVPLLEKAYAKLFGDYKALDGGWSGDAIEDLTGGVSTRWHLADILDEDAFWTDELLLANQDRLFSCSLSGNDSGDVQGLIKCHAYSVIAAMEIKGKRFVKIRNPWGQSEWTGRWGDGSKEWTGEWLTALADLNHRFGDDGEFIMEYSDFLNIWGSLERTRIFDSTWRLSSQWLTVSGRPYPAAWNFGDVSFTVSVGQSTPAILVLSQVETRYFGQLVGATSWSFEFVVYKHGDSESLARSPHTVFYRRSLAVELDLEAGVYVVQVRLDRNIYDVDEDQTINPNKRKLVRKYAEQARTLSIASNFDPECYGDKLPVPLEQYTGKDLTEIEIDVSQKEQDVKDTENAPRENREHEKGTAKPREPDSEAIVEDKPVTLESVVGKPSATDHAEDGVPNGQTSNPSGDPVSVINTEPSSMLSVDTVTIISAAQSTSPTTMTVPTSPKVLATSTSTDGTSPVTHVGVLCDICKMNPITGIRYHCMDASCGDFDMCDKCASSAKHPASHRLLRISTTDGPDLSSVSGDPADQVTLGLKVYTKEGVPADVKGQLRHGSMLKWTKQ